MRIFLQDSGSAAWAAPARATTEIAAAASMCFTDALMLECLRGFSRAQVLSPAPAGFNVPNLGAASPTRRREALANERLCRRGDQADSSPPAPVRDAAG